MYAKGEDMSLTKIKNHEARLHRLLVKIAELGPMRPGTLTVQFRDPVNRTIPFNQLSYTHQGRSRSEYVRPENLRAIKREVATFKKFKLLVESIGSVSLQISKLRHQRI